MPVQEEADHGSWVGLADRLSPDVRDTAGLPKVLASHGALEVRLATTTHEIHAAQRLRYHVFFEQGRAEPDPTSRRMRRDLCRFDEVCDHLIVVDGETRGPDGAPATVGAYRLLRQDVAKANFGFYSAREFKVDALIHRHPTLKFLELGRSCVAEGYRGKRTAELLWRGIWAYAQWHRIDAMFGCASLPGAEPSAHAAALRFLRGEAGADPSWAVEPTQPSVSPLDVDAPALDPRAALRDLPPLIKGYWRLGARFAPCAAPDPAFGTTDVFVLLLVTEIEQRYLQHFAPKDAAAPIAA